MASHRASPAALVVLARRKPDRPLNTNLEFTGVFAMARVVGWIAHALDQQRVQQLIRPQSRYVGPVPAPTKPHGPVES